MKPFLLTLFILISPSLLAKKKAIYGLDNRTLLSQVNDQRAQEWGEAIASLIPLSHLTYRASKANYKIKPFEQKKLCSGETQLAKRSLSACTGFIVEEDLLVTAGHCIRSQCECEKMAFAFTHRANQRSTSDIVRHEDVYFCQQLVNRDRNRFTGNDFAIVKLDRYVEGRAPLLYRSKGKIGDHDPLEMIGHGLGWPLVYSATGKILDNSKDYIFKTGLDSFLGNSGSPVFNSDTGLVEGLLSDGEEDFVFDKKRNCYVNRVCSEDLKQCQGEYVVRITVIPELVPDMTPQGPVIDPDNPFALF